MKVHRGASIDCIAVFDALLAMLNWNSAALGASAVTHIVLLRGTNRGALMYLTLGVTSIPGNDADIVERAFYQTNLSLEVI